MRTEISFRKPNVMEFLILMAFSRGARQRMVKTVGEQQVSIVVKLTWIGGPFVVLCTSQIFSGSFASRRGSCQERDGVCTVNTSPYAHTRLFFSLSTSYAITRLAQGFDDSLCVWKTHFVIGHVFVECSFDQEERSPMLKHGSVVRPRTSPSASPTPLTGIRLNPCATPLWNGRSGRLADPTPNTGTEKLEDRTT